MAGAKVAARGVADVSGRRESTDYVVDQDGRLTVARSAAADAASRRRLWPGVRGAFMSMFLPIGYPQSVAEEYLRFQAWDTLQAVCSYLRGIFATQAVLEGVGVGEETATPIAAALQWVTRDGAGMLGGLLFAWWGGPRFDADVKTWRMFADLAVDFALVVEMVAPMFPRLFLLLICLASVAKSMCGVAAGSTRASLTNHFALRGNVADLAAKEGTQETAVTLLGLLCGMAAARALGHSPAVVWLVFLLLTALHVAANYMAMRTLRLRTLNAQRLHLLLRAFIHGDDRGLTVPAIAAQERILPMPWQANALGGRVELGCALHDVANAAGVPWKRLCDQFRGSRYMLALAPRPIAPSLPTHVARARRATALASLVRVSGRMAAWPSSLLLRAAAPPAAPRVLVALAVDATPEDELYAYLHAALLLRHWLERRAGDRDGQAAAWAAVCVSDAEAKRRRAELARALEERGWDGRRLLVPGGGGRFELLDD